MDPNDPRVVGLIFGSHNSEGFQDLVIAGRSTRDARYAIAAMLSLQMYELIAWCVARNLYLSLAVFLPVGYHQHEEGSPGSACDWLP